MGYFSNLHAVLEEAGAIVPEPESPRRRKAPRPSGLYCADCLKPLTDEAFEMQAKHYCGWCRHSPNHWWNR